MIDSFLKAEVSNPIEALVLMIALIIASGVGTMNLWQAIEYKVYFSKTDPLRLALDDIETKVGAALVVTTVDFNCGFGALAFNNYSFYASMGLLTAITICFAFTTCFLLLPALLMLFDSGKSDAPTFNNGTARLGDS